MGNLDINIGKLKKNAFRYSKVRGETASRIRIPGGVIDAASLGKVVEIAEKYGNGVIDITNRQGIEIPGIKLTDMDAEIQGIIEALEINQKEPGMGYPSSGTRNIQACPGSRLCPFGCYDTTAFAQKMEKLVYPNDRHVKIAFTGCSNDCGKVRMADFGIIGMTEPQYDPNRCVGCEQWVRRCALTRQRQSRARYRQVHRLRRLRSLLPDKSMDTQQGALFPSGPARPYRQEKSAPRGGLHQVVR